MRSKAGGGSTRGQTKAGLPEKERKEKGTRAGKGRCVNPENSPIAAKRGSRGGQRQVTN